MTRWTTVVSLLQNRNANTCTRSLVFPTVLSPPPADRRLEELVFFSRRNSGPYARLPAPTFRQHGLQDRQDDRPLLWGVPHTRNNQSIVIFSAPPCPVCRWRVNGEGEGGSWGLVKTHTSGPQGKEGRPPVPTPLACPRGFPRNSDSSVLPSPASPSSPCSRVIASRPCGSLALSVFVCSIPARVPQSYY